ncbi:YciI family protein [Marinicella meishanensis]|uniref:YciI family protein n=1 Tax=Marinicella meishanensis TaxID=2873263 RepID=UPI001CBE0CBE|nr:YciI family protein [Marinicella sp. NBU2979]
MRILLMMMALMTGFAVWAADALPPLPPEYDEALATELGADDYGMKMYVMALLKAGPKRPDDPEQARQLQAAHMANIKRLAEAGQLVLAGPYGDNDSGLKGIYVFAVGTVEEAKALTETDPAIQAGSLVMELIPWYGSAALMQVNVLSKKLARKSF